MPFVTQFEQETTVIADGPGRWRSRLTPFWNIGDNANGGYALSPVLRAASSLVEHPDPLSVTVHYLRPVQPDGTDFDVTADLVKAGRSTSVVRGTLIHEGKDRLTLVAAFGDLAITDDAASSLAPVRPTIPPPDDCLARSGSEQGVDLPILERVEVRIHPDAAVPGASSQAVMQGWIRLADGTDPTTSVLPLFADAFPPSLFPLLGRVGWVPTVELTVHVRRRPAPGWVQARFECDDLTDGRMIETGTLWDSTGCVVARSRQLGLLLTERPGPV